MPWKAMVLGVSDPNDDDEPEDEEPDVTSVNPITPL